MKSSISPSILALTICTIISPLILFSQGGDLLHYEVINYTFSADRPNGFIASPGNTTTAYIRTGESPFHRFVRYKSNLQHDESFGDGGIVTTNISGSFREMLPASDGGFYITSSPQNIYKYLPNGEPDLMFGDNGRLIVDFLPLDDYLIRRMAFKDDGSIILLIEQDQQFYLFKLDATGEWDQSFAIVSIPGQVVITPENLGSQDFGFHLHITSQQQILVAGEYLDTLSNESSFIIHQFNEDGSPNIDYGTDGKITLSLELVSGDDYYLLIGKMDTQDRLIVGVKRNFSASGHFIIRVTADGQLDTGFGPENNQIISGFRDIDLDPEDKMYTTDRFYDGSINKFKVKKYFENGMTDTSFGDNGSIIVNFLSKSCLAYFSVLGPDAIIYTIGTTSSFTGNAVDSNTAIAKFSNSCEETTMVYPDVDGDGYGANNQMVEICGTVVPDSYTQIGGDCNDNNANINPDALEICNLYDDNCDGLTNEGFDLYELYADDDQDGFGSGTIFFYCDSILNGYTTNALDCNDDDVSVNPGAIEICNMLDDNCDGVVDEGYDYFQFYLDQDEDGFGSEEYALLCESSPPLGYASNNLDCVDTNPNINPAWEEIPYDGIDNDCNEETLDDDLDQDGFLLADDCDDNNPQINPNVEEIADNGIDEDCDGMDLITSSTNEIGNSRIVIFPNPASFQIQIQVEGSISYEARMYSLLGKQIYYEQNPDKISVQNISNGTYLLEIQDVNSSSKIIERVVVIK